MDIDLHTDSPEPYIAEATPLDLANAIHRLLAWDAHALRVADYLFNAWVLIQVRREEDAQGLGDLEYALHNALERARSRASLPESWRARWSGYHDLVGNRARLRPGQSEIADLLARKHVPEILGYLARAVGETRQTELRDAHGLSHERLSQILRQLETRQIIRRRRQGKENMIALTESGQRHAPQPQAEHSLAGRTGMADPTALDAYLEAA